MKIIIDKIKSQRAIFGIVMAVLAAALYGISAPVSKLLLVELKPTLLAALLYLGAGIGMLIVNSIKSLLGSKNIEAKMTKKELPYAVGMMILDIIAPILLMVGLTMTSSANTSLLNNFEIVATALIAMLIFSEAVSRRMWAAIILITISVVILSFEGSGALSFSWGSLLIIGACICWGVENNITRRLSIKDPLQIVVVKGLGSGTGALIIALFIGDLGGSFLYVLYALVLGFFAYGLGIFLYILAQRDLGAARTSAYYATAPFIGVVISWIFLHEGITTTFLIALGVMLIGTYFAVTEKHGHKHEHNILTHEHKHSHDDMHHDHSFEGEANDEHSHEHVHKQKEHKHDHLPDLHHRHKH